MSRAIRSRRSSRRAWLTRIAASSHNGVGYKNSAPVYGSMNETGNSAYNWPRGPCATVILGTSTIDNADPWTRCCRVVHGSVHGRTVLVATPEAAAADALADGNEGGLHPFGIELVGALPNHFAGNHSPPPFS
jgi:hypothetical protein